MVALWILWRHIFHPLLWRPRTPSAMSDKMSISTVAVLFFLFAKIISASIYRTAKYPIILKLQRNINRNSSAPIYDSNIKTKPELFQEALGLIPNSTFCLNYDSWLELKSSGLFHNLTAKSFMRNNEIYLEISGIELPSTEFTPEVSVQDVSKTPDFSGGVITALQRLYWLIILLQL